MSAIVYAGSTYPDAVRMTVRAAATGVSLATATSATIYAMSPTGVEKTWAATVSQQTAESVMVTHALADGDVTESEVGRWRCFAVITLANSDTHRSKSGQFQAVSKYGQ